MRFLGIGDCCDLGSLYLRLIEAGHEVRISIANPLCRGTLAGMVTQTEDWRAELDWIRAADTEGIILFENVAKSRGEVQDSLRRDDFHVIGGSAYGDKLENDRFYAQKVLADIGLPSGRVWQFDNRTAALAFIDANPGRYVLKFDGPLASLDNYVGRLDDGRDLRAFLAKLPQAGDAQASFILMEHLDGVEMGVGAYFDGEKFLTPACLDWEHKRFFPGDLGELTGEMGTVVTYSRTNHFFERTLGRMAPLLRENGYCGYINLNAIVNERGIWPLEFTCRFGYPGYAILDPLQDITWADLFHAMVTRSRATLPVHSGFSVGVVLTTPPFPYSRPQVMEPLGLPVIFDGEPSAEECRHLHYGEVGLEDGALVTSGIWGWTMVVTGVAPTIADAQQRANALADRVLVPNVRYRRDIGAKLIAGDYVRVERCGLLDP
jgi:phosphoribosylamine--glycine ligase